jgi:GNAT superfamily N-acetyltransferase
MISISSNKKSVTSSEVCALYVDLGWGDRKKYPAARMKRSLANCDIVISARNEAGELVGVMRALSDFAFETKVLDMVIDPDYQRQGIGKKAMKVLEKLVPGTTIYCETENKNLRVLIHRVYHKRPGLTVFKKSVKKSRRV